MKYKKLIDELQECGVIKFGDFSLTSGIKSKYYIDVKKAITRPKILELICEQIIDIIVDQNIKVDYIACVELGAVPIGTIISIKTGLPLIIIRKTEKNHGLENRIIGDPEKTKIALLVEDITTTGGSVIDAVGVMRNEGLIVKNVISVVDRGEGAKESIEKECLNITSLVKIEDLISLIV